VKRRKHVPLRTCIVCQEKHPKRELIRVVRRPEGCIELDPTGKLSGRGAYLCRDARCWEPALVQRQLQKALACKVTAEEVAALRLEAEPLFTESATNGSTMPSVEGRGA
jgi:predicted RNA-binding protein YlxR (DUF448 family)